jgi:hypothetical protein
MGSSKHHRPANQPAGAFDGAARHTHRHPVERDKEMYPSRQYRQKYAAIIEVMHVPAGK